jgi:hypothetical protein
MSFDQALLAGIAALTGAIVFMYVQVTLSLRDAKNDCLAREAKLGDKHDKLLERVIRMETSRSLSRDAEDTFPGVRSKAG